MEDAALLAALVELAEELGLPVRRLPPDPVFDGVGPSGSGLCTLRGRRMVWLAPSDPPERQAEVLARALREHAGESLEMRFLPPAIRECLNRGA
ncbi:MAG TPA: hypothetical protein VMW19_05685 [Myxococcota bacterium]|nr:hypothetical protein [Myxococcota bacterium]